jgi:S1-C subfamily serine protease
MANALKELSAALRAAIQKASGFTAGVERRPYHVSGVLIGGDRLLTASHLVGDDGAEVVLPDGSRRRATLGGRDPIHDLALLRVQGASAPAMTAAAATVGDLVLSIRRDPFDGINASLAMVSAAGQKLRVGSGGVLERYFQTDAERLPGTTGGPVVDAEGGLVGIQVFNRRMGAEVALPADLALSRARLLEEAGSIKRPYLGVRSQEVPLTKAGREAVRERQQTGLLLIRVESASAAEGAGLEVGDILVGMGGTAVKDHEELVAVLSERGAGAQVEIELIRGGRLERRPATIGAA